MNKVRTRFAPSPTGFLHIGSLRTVLFGYLIAKKYKGDFILRIEDTDQKRQVEGAVEKLQEIIAWLGIEFDEGPGLYGEHGPYIQSERIEIYNKFKNQLLEKGEAYPCFCSSERLQKMREDQQKNKQAPRYDRCCRDLSKENVEKKIKNGESFVIRQKIPLEGEITVYDELKGEIKFKCADLDDQILIKANGIPTYQFANVVDDHEMKISHVLRGDEWIPSFPKNILLYQSFGWTPPKFVHMPLTLNKGGGKLSKRQGDVAVEDYRDKGYLQEALINFSILQGWHPKDDNEILSLDEVREKFEIKDMGTSPGIFDIDKLDYFNGYYIRLLDEKRLFNIAKPFWQKFFQKNMIALKDFSNDYLLKITKLEQERMKKFSEIGESTKFFFSDFEYEKELLLWKKLDLS